MFEQILCLASAITQPSEAEKSLLEALCTAAEAELKQRLREGVGPEECQETFACAAALLAAAGLLPCRSSGDVEQFTAGDVSVKTGSSNQVCEASAAMRRQAASMMAAYCGDDAFAFRGVQG